MAFVDAVDSHYQYVKGRMATINPSRVVAGLLEAQDWPPKNVKLDAFYLLILAATSIGRQGYSASTPIKFHQCQWVWINKGTDLQQGVRSANRGDRFRTMEQMQGELIEALYPNFCEKQTWALDANGNWVGTSLNPVEYITWTPVELYEKGAMDSGVRYGSGAVKIFDMTDTITS